MQSSTMLFSGNAAFIEELYERFLADPASVDEGWRGFFRGLQAAGTAPEVAHAPIRERLLRETNASRPRATAAAHAAPDDGKQVAVLQLINAHRFLGHRQARLDPLNQAPRPAVPELDPAHHGLGPEDLERSFNTGSLAGPARATLRQILEIVRNTYCGSVGAEYMHIAETAQKRWIQQRLEPVQSKPAFDAARKRQIMDRLIAAQTLEEYLHTKYVGQKRFSLEGGESTIPVLDQIVADCGRLGIHEMVIGMAHRGRLNVLVNIVGKHPSKLFEEFEGKSQIARLGDVKYHLGYSSDIETPDGGPVHVTLAFNPSHLEIINPVVEGSVRARQDERRDSDRNQVLPVLIHGDAAFAGQGVVMETLNLSQTRGYSTGGTVHLIINNQIGFTTSDPLDSRSTLYCTDVAKMVQAPIFHVNGDDPEAVVMVTQLALEFRMEFKKDVVIDVVCYRKHGHSEADEPFATQPLMYQAVRKHPGVKALYAERLVAEGVLRAGEADELKRQYVAALESGGVVSRPHAHVPDTRFKINFEPYRKTHWRDPADTALAHERVLTLTERLTTVPAQYELHKAVRKVYDDRRKMGAGKMPLDWGYAETLAYAGLLTEGYPVRISGQDSGRGTFFHRHAVVTDQRTGETHLPLQNLSADQANFLVINSTLSEEAVLGFEYGYASSAPQGLVVWEAQFGDFANGAQVVIDQFIASCEEKWGRFCGLALFLPHGYDGQGPEHSSARLERYLQLCAEENMQVVYPTTPAQMFHLIRRQVLRPYRKPLVVMSPKSLLRHKLSVSTLDEIEHGGFRTVIDEIDAVDRKKVTRLLFCSGKVYFDLLEARRERGLGNVAILRLEQLYPFPREEIVQLAGTYPNVREVVWVQEEPRNQGAWSMMLSKRLLGGCFPVDVPLRCVARPYSASPAVGYLSLHQRQQQEVVDEALRPAEPPAAAQPSAKRAKKAG